jgi:hypothetical protein
MAVRVIKSKSGVAIGSTIVKPYTAARKQKAVATRKRNIMTGKKKR